MDDVNPRLFYWVRVAHSGSEEGQSPKILAAAICAATVGEDLNPDFTKKRTLLNMYMQDRAAMKSGDFHVLRQDP